MSEGSNKASCSVHPWAVLREAKLYVGMRALAQELCMSRHGCSLHRVQSLRSMVHDHEDVCCNHGRLIWFDCGNGFTNLGNGTCDAAKRG